jgi:hypothetical protein
MNIGIDGDDQDFTADVFRNFNRAVKVLEQTYGSAGSRYRSATKNRSVGGKSFSQHMIGPTGLAADFPSVNPFQVPAFIRDARRLGVWPVNEISGPSTGTGPHMHVQAFQRGATPRALIQRAFEETP